ncbi:hypothetical protein Bbelb_270520 [Branchiostoma belcheri]|nr:hypothetical protein Bbelb_270520 [Branchiostoma belcheri]
MGTRQGQAIPGVSDSGAVETALDSATGEAEKTGDSSVGPGEAIGWSMAIAKYLSTELEGGYLFRATVGDDSVFPEQPSMATMNNSSRRHLQKLASIKEKHVMAVGQVARSLSTWREHLNPVKLLTCGDSAELMKRRTDLRVAYENPAHFIGVQRYWAQRGLPRKITSGFYVITVALMLCEQVNVYGFWPFPFNDSGGKVRYHYYSAPIFFAPETHDMAVEYMKVRELHQKGVIKMQLGKCQEKQPKRKL